MPLATWLLSLVAPFVVRAVLALGFTAITFTGVTVALDSLVSLAQSNWSAISADVLQLATLSGIPQVLGMIMGAYAGRVAVWLLANGSRYILSPK